MNKVKYYILTIISLLLYGFAPNQYDKIYCIICFIIFIIGVYSIVKDDYKSFGIVSFNIIFFFSFFLCTYVFPVFLMGSDSVVSELLSSILGSYHTLSRAVALCSFATSIYGLGYVFFRNKSINERIREKEKYLAKNIIHAVKSVLFVLTIILIYINFEYISIADGEPNIEGFEYLYAVFDLTLPLFFVCAALVFSSDHSRKNIIIVFFKKNSFIILLGILLIIVYILLGNRGPIIQIVFVVISTIMLFLKRIDNRVLLSIGLVAVLVMFTLRTTRQMDNVSTSKGISEAASNANSFWDLFSDLVQINFELNAGMQYVDEHGLLYPGANIIRWVACPIPHLPTMLVNAFYQFDIETASTEQVIKKYTNHSAGNHCVIDTYMCFGVLGVGVVFFLFGLLVAIISNGLKSYLYCKVYYIYLVSGALYFPRASLLYEYRNFVILYFYILLLGLLFNRKKTNI